MVLHFTLLKPTRAYRIIIALLLVVAACGFVAAHFMDAHGHIITGMNNQIVWGVPHVFALALILSASGALNVASLWSVFAVTDYRPLARLSGLLAVALLCGGLWILVMDLGRPERLVVAMTHYNFRSVFAWNIFLYTGFVAVVIAYLWSQFERKFRALSRPLGALAFLWRFVLTAGSGAIFGFLVARPGYDAAILVPLFIALSLSLGSAIFVMVTVAVLRLRKVADNNFDDTLLRLARLLGWFVGAVIFITAVHHLTNFYAAEHARLQRFLLVTGGVYPALFWGAQLLGGVLPAALLFAPGLALRRAIFAAALVVVGGFAQLYVIIIGGQAFPSVLFPGKTVRSSFYDGVIADYAPALPEILLGGGGVALALLVLIIVLRVLPFMPDIR